MLERWELVEADLHEVFGIDVSNRALLRRRSWRWLKVRIEALITATPNLVTAGDRVLFVPRTRLGFALNPPSLD